MTSLPLIFFVFNKKVLLIILPVEHHIGVAHQTGSQAHVKNIRLLRLEVSDAVDLKHANELQVCIRLRFPDIFYFADRGQRTFAMLWGSIILNNIKILI